MFKSYSTELDVCYLYNILQKFIYNEALLLDHFCSSYDHVNLFSSTQLKLRPDSHDDYVNPMSVNSLRHCVLFLMHNGQYLSAMLGEYIHCLHWEHLGKHWKGKHCCHIKLQQSFRSGLVQQSATLSTKGYLLKKCLVGNATDVQSVCRKIPLAFVSLDLC